MLRQILTLELGNDKGLRSSRNMFKILYTYILPNLSVVFIASTLASQRFYDAKQMLLFVLHINVIMTFIIQYTAQRGLFKSLESEVLLKFLPMKIDSFVKIRLIFLMIRVYFPVLLFSLVFTNYFVQGNRFILMVVCIFSSIFIMIFQVYLAIIIRYCVNTFKKLYLHLLQIGLFLLFISYLIFFYMVFLVIFLLETLEDYLNHKEHALFDIDPFYLYITAVFIVVIALVYMMIARRLNINLLIHNRNLSLKLHTVKLERWHERIYGFGLSNFQKLIFGKDIKYIFRHSKVVITLFGFYHVFNTGFMVYIFYHLISEIEEAELFIPKFYLGWMITLFIFTGIFSIGAKDMLHIKNDVKVVRNYHIKLPTKKLIHAKTKILRAFVFPKLTFSYAILIIPLLMMNEFMLAIMLFINYVQCFFCRKTLELWRVKESNKLNSNHLGLSIVNGILILIFINILIQLFHSTPENFFFYQMIFLGMTIVLYCFHSFIFKKNHSDKGGDSYAGN